MNDEKIIEMFFARDENAIKETEEKYTTLCHYVAKNYLSLREDREECINDAMLALWNSIPPAKPKSLSAFLSTTVRRIAISKSRAGNAWKRGGGVQLVNDEILSLIPEEKSLAEYFEAALAGRVINDFLGTLTGGERKVFLLRYFFDADEHQISEQTGFSQSKIRSMLWRLRKRLAERLEKEGIIV